MSKTSLYDTDTREIIFLSDGSPDIMTHTLWRWGIINIYRPGDWPHILVTVDPHGDRTDWPFADPPATPLPPHPWISYDEVIYGLADEEIVAFDIWHRGTRTEPHPHEWEEYDRPVLVRETPPLLAPAPPAPAPAPPPSAPPAPPPSVATTNTFPPHIKRLIIDAAIATGATCPITMETITADTAVLTPCGHVFGTELAPRVSLCPVCRTPLEGGT